MSSIKLGINTGFAVNRFAEHFVWTNIIKEKLELDNVQITADLINMYLPDKLLLKTVKEINKYVKKYNLNIASTFTGAFTRVNHLSHPDKYIRDYWIKWFKRFVDVTIDLGATSMGSHFGIQTLKDVSNEKTFYQRRLQNIECWHEIGEHAKKRGLKFLTWEPMSIKREYGETIKSTQSLQKEINLNSPIPFYLCLDVDHGDVTSSDPDDTDPYIWIDKLINATKIVHLKQSYGNKSGHWPFTKEHNEKGIIHPKKIQNALKKNKVEDIDLVLELSFRERDPIDKLTIDTLKESVSFWKDNLE